MGRCVAPDSSVTYSFGLTSSPLEVPTFTVGVEVDLDCSWTESLSLVVVVHFGDRS